MEEITCLSQMCQEDVKSQNTFEFTIFFYDYQKSLPLSFQGLGHENNQWGDGRRLSPGCCIGL